MVRHPRAHEPEATYGADRDRNRPRGRDDQRHVRPHGLDRLRRSTRSSPTSVKDRTPSSAGSRRSTRRESDASLTPSFDEALLPKVRALPEVANAEGSVSSETTHLIDKDGKVIQFGLGGAPNLGFSIANPAVTLQSAPPRHGRVAGARGGRDRQGDCVEEGPRGGPGHRRPGGGTGRDVPDLGDRPVQLRPHDRRCDPRGLRPPDCAEPCSASEGSWTRSLSPRSRTRPMQRS